MSEDYGNPDSSNAYTDLTKAVGDDIEQDLKLNPDFFWHLMGCNLQKAITDANINEGVLKYCFLAEHAEMLAKARGQVDASYDDNIKAFMVSDEYKKAKSGESDTPASKMILANKKLTLIFGKVFWGKAISTKVTF